MPHTNLPEDWVHAVVYAIGSIFAAVLGFLAKHFLGRVARVERSMMALDRRMVTVERIQAILDVRYHENRDRLARIEEKLDKLIERL